jgi:hypothetical protein
MPIKKDLPNTKEILRELAMGRSFISVRQGVNQIADRWARLSRSLREEDQKYGEKLAKLAKMHSSEAFIACADPLEVAVFSILIEILKHQENPGWSLETPDKEYSKDGVLSLKYWT